MSKLGQKKVNQISSGDVLTNITDSNNFTIYLVDL